MKEADIINVIINNLNDSDIWFTTKQDPTFQDADFYYELDEYGDLTEKSMDKIVKEVNSYIGDGAVDIEGAIDMWVEDNLMKCTLAYKDCLKTQFKPKQVVDQIEAYENSVQMKTESYKARLEEANAKSEQIISSKFTDKDFDSDSKEGQIVIRTSELFNALSSAGYDVQVNFDNGESQSNVLFAKQGGQAIITITNTTEPLRVFASGNFEVTDENLDTLKDIQNAITAI